MGKQNAKKSHKQKLSFWRRHAHLWKRLAAIIGAIVLLALVVWGAFRISPWPNALLIRQGFDKNDAKAAQALEKYVPKGIIQIQDRHYRTNDPDAYLDAFYPEHITKQLPAIVWVHGGAWVAGNKNDVDQYMQILASHGFTTISVNYTLAPEKQYPTPIAQLNDALDYIRQNAKSLHADDSRIVLAGDSAGSQIVAQMANIITSPSYANEIGIQPKLSAENLKGMLLNCGAYDLALPNYNGEFGKFLHTVLWAYAGKQDFLNDPKLKTASVVNYVTPKFPPTFITAGNADPLLAQSTEFAKKLQGLGVPTSTLFYAADHQPQLNHEYQFDLDTSDGKQALQQMIDFLQKYAPEQ